MFTVAVVAEDADVCVVIDPAVVESVPRQGALYLLIGRNFLYFNCHSLVEARLTFFGLQFWSARSLGYLS